MKILVLVDAFNHQTWMYVPDNGTIERIIAAARSLCYVASSDWWELGC